MSTEVNALQIFADADAKLENSLVVMSAGSMPSRRGIAADVGGNATGFVEYPMQGSALVRAETLTRALELLVAGHAADGAAGCLARVFC